MTPLREDLRRALARHLGEPAVDLADDPLLGPTSPHDDPRRDDDPEDHGDPRIEGWAAALVEYGVEVAQHATIGCARLVAPVWAAGHPGDERLERALDACEARLGAGRPIPAAVASAVDDAEREVRWAHEHDAVRGAQAALRAVTAPASASVQAAHAALFALRIVGWATAPGTRSAALAGLESRLRDDPELTPCFELSPARRARAIVRVALRQALRGFIDVDPARRG
ncbi:MAG: hypothetical protein R3B09_19430 [Nannocystaceae bacterium]